MKKISLASILALGLLAGSTWGFNNDGKVDLVFRDYTPTTGGSNVIWFFNNTNYISELVGPFESVTNNYRLVGTADFNGDNQLDWLWFHTSGTSPNAVWYMSGGQLLSAHYLEAVGDVNWELVGTGYFTGYTDKKPDLLFRYRLSGQLAIWDMDGTNAVNKRVVTANPGTAWIVGAVADMNRDGHDDIIFREAGAFQNALWRMNAGQQSSAVLLTSASAVAWEIHGAGHVDSDGKPDIVWRYMSGTVGENAVWYMDDATLRSAGYFRAESNLNRKIGAVGDSKVDADADGLPDLWEKNNWGNLDQTGSGDPDGDGLTNLQEYQGGTSPGLAALTIQISTPRSTGPLP